MVDWLYRDRWLVAVNKPTGLLAVPGRGADKADCLVARVQSALRDEAAAAGVAAAPARVVHRLDRDTSGVMLLALGPESQRRLSRRFATRRVAKRYIAIVHGGPAEDTGRIDRPLRKDLARKYVHIVDHEYGKPAVTHWRVLEREPDRTRLELTPLTGRSHQLRVHLAHAGWPIQGDRLYGRADKALRLMLHATSLTLDHPQTATGLTVTCPCAF
ncbi:MAG: RNA pseudouridine synthase [Alphaproteobacteria bacterium]|nr:RNA pseudouridine synthase [Alphaproteobacteria bacterium]